MNDEQKKSKKKMIKKIQKGGGLKTLKVSSNNKNKNKMEDDKNTNRGHPKEITI